MAMPSANPSTVAQELSGWLGNITQSFGHNGETGIDIGLPYHTPVYAVTPGTVLGVNPQYGGGGVASIDSVINGSGINGPASVYYQHLSDIIVQPGQSIQAGQLIGYSGGQLGYGQNPSSSKFSSGPHIEVGLNAPYGGAWHPLGPNVNPLGFLQGLANGTGGAAPTGATAGTATGTPLVSGGGSILSPTDWVTAIQAGFTDAFQRVGLITFGALIVLVGLVVLFFSEEGSADAGDAKSAAPAVVEAATA